MFVFAVFALAAGAWLLDSAVQNRNPVTSIIDIIRDPASARIIAKDSSGGAYTVDRKANTPTANERAAGNTTGLDPNADNGVNGTTVTANSVSVAALAYARAQLGKPYKWGATGPNAFDCSGLVFKAFASAGVQLPGWPRPTTATMLAGIASGKLTRVSRENLAVGDLVFPDAGHVQIYSGNGRVVEAPSAGKNVREVAMWGFLTAARVKPVTGLNANPSGSGM